MRLLRLPAALLLLVSACSDHSLLPPPAPSPAREARVCRIGPDGGPPVQTAEDGDRGRIAEGGDRRIADNGDRGIGGTGIQLASAEGGDRGRIAEGGDRGIGGTGIVGVVTGFASICVNGMHVGYAPTLPVVFGEVMAPPSALRVGQVVAISAAERDGMLQASRVTVRYEVSGPVEAVEPGAIRVAGQRVTLVGAVPGGTSWRVGDTVLVSGLRAPDGSIIASRIDPRPAGASRTVTVHGLLMERQGVLSVGNLPIRVGPGLLLPDPGPVIATGLIENGVLVPVAVAPDMLLRDPTLWFGPGYGRFFYEGYVSIGAGAILAGTALYAPAPGGIAPFGARRGVVELRPGPAGGLTAAGLRDPAGTPMTGGPLGGLRQAPMPGAMPGGRGAPRGELAPMPDRSFDRRQGPGGAATGRAPGGSPGDSPAGSDRFRRGGSDPDDRPPSGFQPGGFQGNPGGQGGGPQSIGPQGGGFFGRGR